MFNLQPCSALCQTRANVGIVLQPFGAVHIVGSLRSRDILGLSTLFSFQANKNLTSQRIGASQQRFFHRSITCLDVLLRVVPLRVLRCEGSPRQRIKDNLQDGRPNKKSSRTSYALVDGSSQISTVAKSKGILVSIFKVAKLLIEVCYGSLTRAPRKL